MNITLLTRAVGAGGFIRPADTVVVIDVLRATTSMVSMIDAGAERVIPVSEPGKARELAGSGVYGKALLAGEENAEPVPGFDLFNSPLDFTPERVGGSTVIMSTSNGTRAVLAASGAENVIICSITNVEAVAEYCRAEEDLVILCSGNGERVCSEDILCGGMLMKCLEKRWEMKNLDDPALIAMLLAEKYGSQPYHLLRNCRRGQELSRTGYDRDVLECSKRGSSDTVPVLRDGAVVPAGYPTSGPDGKRKSASSLPEPPFLYAILDRSIVERDRTAEAARLLAEGGADMIQYRGKSLSDEEKFKDISVILPETEKARIPLIVNDDPELAARAGAAGVHLGREDPDPAAARNLLGPVAIIGATIHSMAELESAPLDILDYISAGAIFRSSTKPDVEVAGTSFIEQIRERTGVPLVVIGGISPENASDLFESGADGVAVISALLTGNIKKNCFTFRRIIDKNKR